MAYRPQHCTLVVQNTDGSGYLRQFETLAEAKVAYASISASGAAVSLYQPATKSLALFEKVSNDVAEYDNGMTYGTGALVSLNGTVYRLINFIGAGGYGPISHPYLWEDGRVPATGGPPPISNTNTQVTENGIVRIPFAFTPTENATPVRMTKIGCDTTQEWEVDGYMTFCAIYPRYRYTFPDGTLFKEEVGEKDTNGCHYPAGFKLNKISSGESFREIKVLNSLDYGGTMYGPYYQVDTYMGTENSYDVADGLGGKVIQNFISVMTNAGGFWKEHYFQDGDTPYKTTTVGFDKGIWDSAGSPTPNGNYLVTYKVTGDERIHSGHWNVSIVSAGSSPRNKWVFTPEEPDQPPPPPCSVLRKFTNPVNGIVETQCDPDVVYPYTVTDDCEPPATVTINGTEVVVGTNIKTGMNNGYGYVTWGPCSGMIYKVNGTNIFDDSDYNYYSDGVGGFYSELKNPNPCPSAGFRISREVISDYTVTIGGSTYTVGYQYEDAIADGNCGSGIEITSEYVPSGTYIIEYDSNRYYSNGSGSYYTEPVPEPVVVGYEGFEDFLTNEFFSAVYRTRVRPQYDNGSVGDWTDWNYVPEGTLYGSDNEFNYYSDGAGSYYTECFSSGTVISSDSGSYDVDFGCGAYSSGTYGSITYADGNCGTYTEGGANYVGSGTFLANCNDYNYYANGSGGCYQGEFTGTPPSCDSYGTQLSSDGGTQYVNVGCEDWIVGNVGSTTYADGNCGTYTDYFSNYVSNGTYLGNCNDYNYYSNGSGGYYQGEFTGTTYPTGPTGSGGSATNYITINGAEYENGTYSHSEYHDGMGGYYTEYAYSYQTYGYTFVTTSIYDEETLMEVWTQYQSDGNGGYYTT